MKTLLLLVLSLCVMGMYQPPVGTTWQWQLQGTIDTSYDVEVYDIDLYDTPQATIDLLHSQGKKVICYYSAGTYEPWRGDAGDFPQSVIGEPLADFPDEKWLDIRQISVLEPIMRQRTSLAAQKNCDAVEPDNVDGFINNSGFPLSYQDQLNYNTMLSTVSHDFNLAVGLKNDLEQVADLVNLFEFAVNEECFGWNECSMLQPFIDQNKAVFSCEYLEEGATTSVCPTANAMGLSTILKEYDLFAEPYIPCASQIYQPGVGTTWQWQLQGTIDTSYDVDVYDIDLFDTPQSTIDLLHTQGKKVICYYSAGTWEPWRDDAGDFPQSVIGNGLEWYPDEKWLDIRQISVLEPIMRQRTALAAQKNCDGVEPDNVDGFINNSGFPISYQDQLNYNTMIANIAHEENLSVGLKNDLEHVADLVDIFDFAVNEECNTWNECNMLQPFLDQGKAVFHCEYFEEGATASICPSMNAMGLSTILKNYDLFAEPYTSCASSSKMEIKEPSFEDMPLDFDSSAASTVFLTFILALCQKKVFFSFKKLEN